MASGSRPLRPCRPRAPSSPGSPTSTGGRCPSPMPDQATMLTSAACCRRATAGPECEPSAGRRWIGLPDLLQQAVSRHLREALTAAASQARTGQRDVWEDDATTSGATITSGEPAHPPPQDPGSGGTRYSLAGGLPYQQSSLRASTDRPLRGPCPGTGSGTGRSRGGARCRRRWLRPRRDSSRGCRGRPSDGRQGWCAPSVLRVRA